MAKNVKYNAACIDLYNSARNFSSDFRDTILTNYGRLFQRDFHPDILDSEYSPAELVDDLAMIMYEIENDLKELNDEKIDRKDC